MEGGTKTRSRSELFLTECNQLDSQLEGLLRRAKERARKKSSMGTLSQKQHENSQVDKEHATDASLLELSELMSKSEAAKKETKEVALSIARKSLGGNSVGKMDVAAVELSAESNIEDAFAQETAPDSRRKVSMVFTIPTSLAEEEENLQADSISNNENSNENVDSTNYASRQERIKSATTILSSPKSLAGNKYILTDASYTSPRAKVPSVMSYEESPKKRNPTPTKLIVSVDNDPICKAQESSDAPIGEGLELDLTIDEHDADLPPALEALMEETQQQQHEQQQQQQQQEEESQNIAESIATDNEDLMSVLSVMDSKFADFHQSTAAQPANSRSRPLSTVSSDEPIIAASSTQSEQDRLNELANSLRAKQLASRKLTKKKTASTSGPIDTATAKTGSPGRSVVVKATPSDEQLALLCNSIKNQLDLEMKVCDAGKRIQANLQQLGNIAAAQDAQKMVIESEEKCRGYMKELQKFSSMFAMKNMEMSGRSSSNSALKASSAKTLTSSCDNSASPLCMAGATFMESSNPIFSGRLVMSDLTFPMNYQHFVLSKDPKATHKFYALVSVGANTQNSENVVTEGYVRELIIPGPFIFNNVQRSFVCKVYLYAIPKCSVDKPSTPQKIIKSISNKLHNLASPAASPMHHRIAAGSNGNSGVSVAASAHILIGSFQFELSSLLVQGAAQSFTMITSDQAVREFSRSKIPVQSQCTFAPKIELLSSSTILQEGYINIFRRMKGMTPDWKLCYCVAKGSLLSLWNWPEEVEKGLPPFETVDLSNVDLKKIKLSEEPVRRATHHEVHRNNAIFVHLYNELDEAFIFSIDDDKDGNVDTWITNLNRIIYSRIAWKDFFPM